MPVDEHEGNAPSAADPSTGTRQRHSEAAFDVAPELLPGSDEVVRAGADPGEPTAN